MSNLLFTNYIYGTSFRYQQIPHLLLDVDIKMYLPLFSYLHKNKLHFLTDATNYQTCEELANIISGNDCDIIPKNVHNLQRLINALSRNRSNNGMPNDMFYNDEITTKRRVRRGRHCMVV
jgi:hypothetical protein